MGKIFNPPEPKKPEPVRMPVDNDKTAAEAADRQRRRIAARSGRSSTILTRNSGGGGTSSYSNSLLGQG